MAMNRALFPKTLETGLNAVWMASEKLYPLDWPKIFEEKTSTKAFEEQVLRAGLGIAPIKSEGKAFDEDAGGEFWTSRFVHATVGLKFPLTQEALEDNLYNDLGATFTQELMRAMRESEEIMAANVFNNAFSANMGDGVPLLSTAHPLWGGGTYSNKLATPADLAESSLEDALIMIRNAMNDRGLPIAINPKQLIHGNGNVFNAVRILRSQQRVGTDFNDVNAIKQLGVFDSDPVTLRRLSDPDAWFVQTDATMGLQFFTRVALQKGGQEDFNTGNFEYKARKRFSVGNTNPRSLFGSEGA